MTKIPAFSRLPFPPMDIGCVLPVSGDSLIVYIDWCSVNYTRIVIGTLHEIAFLF